MRMNAIRSEAELAEGMTETSPRLVAFMRQLKGDIVGLGATGKMGLELIAMIVRADWAAGKRRIITVASTFSHPEHLAKLRALGVRTQQGDLCDDRFLKKAAMAENVFFMAGFKFGSSLDYRQAFRLNVILPYKVGEKYRHSRIVAFSSCNIYRHVDPASGGAREDGELNPIGIYGWTVLGRENAFRIVAEKHGTPACLYRLAYAQHFMYGVIVDIAKLIRAGKPVCAPLPYVNLISQRDANEAAIRCLALCANPPKVVNICGPVVPVKYIAAKLAKRMGKKAVVKEPRNPESLLGNDALARRRFGPYRDSVDDMIEGVADWVVAGSKDWNKPTGFASADHRY